MISLSKEQMNNIVMGKYTVIDLIWTRHFFRTVTVIRELFGNFLR